MLGSSGFWDQVASKSPKSFPPTKYCSVVTFFKAYINAFILSSAKNNYEICWPFSVLFFGSGGTQRLERRHLRRLYYHLLWATCVLKRQCGGAEKLECLQNAKDRNSESRNSEKTFETWNISKPFSEMVKNFGVTYLRCDMVSIRRCHVLCDSIRPLALLISSHVSCKRPSFCQEIK